MVLMLRIGRILLGILCLLLAVAGSLLPILQGWMFLALGALLLSPEVPIFRRLVEYIEKRFPKSRKFLDKFSGWRKRKEE